MLSSFPLTPPQDQANHENFRLLPIVTKALSSAKQGLRKDHHPRSPPLATPMDAKCEMRTRLQQRSTAWIATSRLWRLVQGVDMRKRTPSTSPSCTIPLSASLTCQRNTLSTAPRQNAGVGTLVGRGTWELKEPPRRLLGSRRQQSSSGDSWRPISTHLRITGSLLKGALLHCVSSASRQQAAPRPLISSY